MCKRRARKDSCRRRRGNGSGLRPGVRPGSVLAESVTVSSASRDDSPGNLQFGRVNGRAEFRQRILAHYGGPPGLRGDTRHRGENENSPKNRIPDESPL